MKAMLIEDDLAVRQALLPMLARHGIHSVEVVEDSSTAEQVMRSAPDVILLAAASLYDRWGRYLPRQLRRASPRSRLLVLGGPQPSRPGPAWTDVDGFLPYPIDAERLARAIDLVLQAPGPTANGAATGGQPS